MSRLPFPSPADLMSGGRTSHTEPQMSSAARVSVPRLELCVEREGGMPASRSLVLDGDFFRVGSHPSNDLVIDDRLVSRFHFSVERVGETWRLSDTGSLNGTKVGGLRVRDVELLSSECLIELGESAVRVRALGSTNDAPISVQPSFGDLYGTSMPMRRLYELLKRVAKSDADVLIEGESGTGKELVATELVRRSSRAGKPLVIVDCGAISPTLLESELFGHTRGAFTGAISDRAGAFEAADGGTVFLDEIGELPLEMQPKLLRALSAREVRRLGEGRVRKVDVRMIAATNRRLEREVNSGRFREDLYYRLSVVTVRVPPLRDRRDDVQILVEAFLSALGQSDKSALFPSAIIEEMMRYDWPGNVRELRNYVERRVVLEGEGAPLEPRSALDEAKSGAEDATTSMETSVETPFKQAKEAVIESFERSYLSALMRWADGNVSRAARKAGLDRMYLHRLLQRYGLKRSGALVD